MMVQNHFQQLQVAEASLAASVNRAADLISTIGNTSLPEAMARLDSEVAGAICRLRDRREELLNKLSGLESWLSGWAQEIDGALSEAAATTSPPSPDVLSGAAAARCHCCGHAWEVTQASLDEGVVCPSCATTHNVILAPLLGVAIPNGNGHSVESRDPPPEPMGDDSDTPEDQDGVMPLPNDPAAQVEAELAADLDTTATKNGRAPLSPIEVQRRLEETEPAPAVNGEATTTEKVAAGAGKKRQRKKKGGV